MDKGHLLVVDDDTRLRDLLRTFLSRQGFRVTVAADAAEARDKLAALEFDLMVLDVMMPGESGLDLAASLRRERSVPILMLTAMGEARDRIAGLERGVDDYLAKPFEPRELLLRIESILRRAQAAPAPRPQAVDTVAFGDYAFEVASGALVRADRRVKLTEAETALLRLFALNAGRIMSRETLVRLAGSGWNERTIDVQVTRLRRKIEPDPKFPQHLQTVRGTGYRFVAE